MVVIDRFHCNMNRVENQKKISKASRTHYIFIFIYIWIYCAYDCISCALQEITHVVFACNKNRMCCYPSWCTQHFRYTDMTLIVMMSQSPATPVVNSLFGLKTKKTQKLPCTGPLRGIYSLPLVSPHKEPLLHKTLLCHDVIMWLWFLMGFSKWFFIFRVKHCKYLWFTMERHSFREHMDLLL